MVTQKCPFLRGEKVRIYLFWVDVYHKGGFVCRDYVHGKDTQQAIKRATYVAGTLARMEVHPNEFVREQVTFRVSLGEVHLFDSAVANVATVVTRKTA